MPTLHNGKICLWSSPRNLSTALMYSFAQRPDTVVFDEPLYAHYLSVSGTDHPGREETLMSQTTDATAVINNIILGNHAKPVSFFKQMTHHLVGIDTTFLAQVNNILFIRNPAQIISSYAAVRPDVQMKDIGIAGQWKLFLQLKEKQHIPVVLDSGVMLQNPAGVLYTLCEALGIPWYEAMLHWPPGPKPYDGVWAKYWYDNVHRSTGFKKQETSSRELPAYLRPLYEESKAYYDQLLPYTINV